MLLVAMSVYRLRPNWLRTAAMCLVVGWAALSGYKEVTEFHRLENITRVKWEALVQQMTQAEPARSDQLTVYVLDEVYMKWHFSFYLDEAQEKRFRVLTASDFDAVNEDHFWVACYGSQEQGVRDELTDVGFRVGEEFNDGHKVSLFPVWRRLI